MLESALPLTELAGKRLIPMDVSRQPINRKMAFEPGSAVLHLIPEVPFPGHSLMGPLSFNGAPQSLFSVAFVDCKDGSVADRKPFNL